jgi:N-acetylglucosamine-6-phosphate deacetylase
MHQILKVKELFTPMESISDAIIAWDESGIIMYAGARENAPDLKGEVLDLIELTALPGLIDIHVHGGWGVEFGTGDLLAGLQTYSENVTTSGVTGFLLTVSGPTHNAIVKMISEYVPLLERTFPGAVPLGFHLEGPFLNPEQHGAFNPNWLHNPSIKEVRDYIDAAQGWLRQVSLAPELENAFETAAYLREHDIRASLAHTSAGYETAAKALAGDFTHVTHTFNAQSSFHHRNPGVVGAILASDNVSAELIADTVHVHPGAMKVLVRCLGSERIVLITDAMPGAGMADGEYTLVGQQVKVKKGKAYLQDGTIAGSVATLDKCMHNMVKTDGVLPLEAARMVSLNPATVINMEDTLGIVAVGRNADITLIDRDMKVCYVFVCGQQKYPCK